MKGAHDVIDSRPKERKYDKGHIPGAISIPDLQFDKLVDRLPPTRQVRSTSTAKVSPAR
jgi:rhodanese-related sulfurtransferase